MLLGHATAAGTAAFAARCGAGHAADFYREVLGVQLSNLGLGTYLGSPDDATDAGYRSALEVWLRGGVNLIDTAINYRAQGSERALGASLAAAFAAGLVTREEVFVSSKGGFNPSDRDDPERGGEALFKGIPPEEIVRGSHCLHPRYLERVLARSRENLGLETLDLYYLHNPETQLGEVAKPIAYERIRRAFTVLEAARERGEIVSYGVATWGGLRLDPSEAQALDLSRLVEVARSVGGEEHGFRAVQLPYSAGLPEARSLPTQRVGDDVLAAIPAARALGLNVFTSGPLAQGKLLQSQPSAPLRERFPSGTPAQQFLDFARRGGDCTLVGTANPEHAREGLALAARPLG